MFVENSRKSAGKQGLEQCSCKIQYAEDFQLIYEGRNVIARIISGNPELTNSI